MAIWYRVEKSTKGITDFLESNVDFHDYRIEKIEYIQEMNMVNMLMIYDTEDEGVLLKFGNVSGMGIRICDDYLCDYLSGCQCFIDDGQFFWFDSDDIRYNETEKIKQYCNWVRANDIYWAITDSNGKPIEMPKNRIDSVWNAYGQIVNKHFDLKEYKGLPRYLENKKWHI